AHAEISEVFKIQSKKDVLYTHMIYHPRKYRGQVIHIDGELRRLRRLDAPALITKEGLEDIYEAWVYPLGNRFNPLCIVITDLPAGLAASENYSPPLRVSFDGYFFKLYRYPTGEMDDQNKQVR